MRSSVQGQPASAYLVIFDLPAVIEYNQADFRTIFLKVLSQWLQEPLCLSDQHWEENCTGVLLDVFRKYRNRFPDHDEYQEIKSVFLAEVKRYFMQQDGRYDVRPGVQNLFMALREHPEWDFCILSDYWRECTDFILDSSGIYRKNIRMYHADDALSPTDIVHQLTSYRGRFNQKTYILSREDHFQHTPLPHNIHLITLESLGNNTGNFFVYPRFQDLFGPNKKPEKTF